MSKDRMHYQKPVKHIVTRYQPYQLFAVMDELGFHFRKQLSSRRIEWIRPHFREWLGQFPKCVLENFCAALDKGGKK